MASKISSWRQKLHRKIQKASAGEIASTTHKSKKEVPPLLYDLTELQKDANRKFKFSAEETLKIMLEPGNSVNAHAAQYT